MQGRHRGVQWGWAIWCGLPVGLWLALGSASASQATLVAPPPNPTDDCRRSPSCLYQRSNEVLILQANYMYAKAMKLAALFGSGGNQGKVKLELGAFCNVQRAKDGSRASERACLESYLLQVKKALRAMRTAMVRNEDMVSKLAERGEPSVPTDGAALAAAAAGADQPRDWTAKLTFDAPFFPALEDVDPILKKLGGILTARQQASQGQAQLDQELQAWWDAYPRCPSREEFIAVELVERFPANPTGEMIRRVKLKADGKTVEVDEAAFAKSDAECQLKRKDWVRSGPMASIPSAEPALLGSPPSSFSIDTFAQAQDQLVDCMSANPRGTGKSGKGAQVNLCGAGRRPGKASAASMLSDSEFLRAEQAIDQALAGL